MAAADLALPLPKKLAQKGQGPMPLPRMMRPLPRLMRRIKLAPGLPWPKLPSCRGSAHGAGASHGGMARHGDVQKP